MSVYREPICPTCQLGVSICSCAGKGLPVIRVTVEDVETGDRDVKQITDDVVVVCAGKHYVHHVAKHANGTQIWTIKVDR